MMIVVGPSHKGKTHWANRLFRKAHEITIGPQAHFPGTMKKSNREKHDSLVLDDVRDLELLASHQEKCQASSHRAIEFASTQGDICSNHRYLCRVPIVATVNFRTANLHYLHKHDWLSHEANRVITEWPAAVNAAHGHG